MRPRSEELGWLRELWDEACAGNPRAVLVTGDGGIGKSWLLRAFRAGLEERALLVAQSPIVAGLLKVATPLLLRERDPSFLVAATRFLPNGPWSGLADAGNLEGSREQSWLALAAALERAARRAGGLALLLEDAHHWSSDDVDALAAMIGHLMGARAPVLVVVTVQHPGRDDLRRILEDETGIALRLEPFDAEGTAVLVGDLLHARSLPDGLVSWLQEQTGGHPLHSVELVRLLVEGGSLSNDGFQWSFRAPDRSLVPAGLEQTLIARLETARGDGELWQALSVLALLERPAGLPEWSRLSRLSRELLEELGGEGARLGLIRLTLQGGDSRYSLAHGSYPALIRGAIPREGRRALHRSIADSASDPNERARHARLGNHPRAAEWTRQALEEARLRFAHSHVESHARALIDMGGDGDEELHLLLGEALYRQGKFEEVLSTVVGGAHERAALLRAMALRRLGRLQEALENARAAGEAGVSDDLLALQASLLVQAGRADEGRALIDRLLRQAPGDSYGRSLALLEQGRFEHHAGRFAHALEVTEQAIASLRRVGENAELTRALNNAGIYASQLGMWERSRAALAECIALTEASGDVSLLASRYLNLASLHYRHGEYEEAAALYGRALATAERNNDAEVRASSLASLAELRFLAGDLPAAQALCRRGLAVLNEIGDERSAKVYGLFLAQVEAHLGSTAAARRTVETTDLALHPLLPLSAAQVFLLAGDQGRALRLLAQVDSNGFRPAMRIQLGLALHLCRLAGDPGYASSDDVPELLALARAEGHRPYEGEALAHLAVIEARRGSAGRAAELARQAVELLSSARALGHAMTIRAVCPDAARLLAGEPEAAPRAPFLRTLGRFELERDGLVVPWKARKPRELLALLLVAAFGESGAVSRGRILATLWPEAPTDQAEASLRTTVKRLREALGDQEYVQRTERGEYRLAGVGCDAFLLSRAVEEGDHASIVELYRGELLPDQDVPGLAEVRETFRSRFRDSVLVVAARSAPGAAAELYRRLLEDDPFDTEAVRLLADRLAALGETGPLRRLVDECRRRFLHEFGEIPGELEGLVGFTQLSR